MDQRLNFGTVIKIEFSDSQKYSFVNTVLCIIWNVLSIWQCHISSTPYPFTQLCKEKFELLLLLTFSNVCHPSSLTGVIIVNENISASLPWYGKLIIFQIYHLSPIFTSLSLKRKKELLHSHSCQSAFSHISNSTEAQSPHHIWRN